MKLFEFAFVWTLTLALLLARGEGQSVGALNSGAQDTQSRAERLLDKARQLSDIRSAGAPPFQLKATFSYLGDHFEKVEGTYAETWVSTAKFRREIIVGKFHRIEVGSSTRLWQLDDTGDFPAKAAQFPSVLAMFVSNPQSLEFESIVDHSDENPPVECALTKPGSLHQRSAFCFDKKSGVLLERSYPELRLHNMVQDSCDYGTFQKFGSFWYPREMACLEDRHKKIEGKIVDIIIQQDADPALFNPPPGALEIGRCTGTVKPPVVSPSATLEPPFEFRDAEPAPPVEVSVLVDAKGKPTNAKIVKPGKPDYDKAAIKRVHSWWFKPATCNGEPMPMLINVEVDFSFRRHF